MDPVSIVIGLAAIAYGCYTFYLRTTNPSEFGKLGAIKERFGDGPGTLIHTVAYSLVPIGFGVVSLVHGLKGHSLFGQ